MIYIKRKEHFCAAHKLWNDKWDAATNKRIFGKCSNENYHGHNFELEVTVRGEINPDTGFVMNLFDLKQIVREHVIDVVDHKNLNLDVPEFKDLNPTAENIVVVIYDKLKKVLDSNLDLEVTLYETVRNFVTYSGN